MSLILNGIKHPTPNLKTVSWLDPEASQMKIKEVTDKNKRTTWIRSIVCHTVHGLLGKLLPGEGPDTKLDERYANYQVTTDRDVSWDFTCDLNGDWIIQNDPLKYFTWHATSVNPHTCGFEFIQKDNGDLYEGQVAKAVLFIDILTAKLGIQRQIPWDFVNNKPNLKPIQRIAGVNHGKDVIGIYNHSNQTANKGPGDCGPWLPKALKEAGYELFNFDNSDDIIAWKKRQKDILGFTDLEADGIAGPKTVQTLKSKGYKNGMYIQRPIDSLIG